MMAKTIRIDMLDTDGAACGINRWQHEQRERSIARQTAQRREQRAAAERKTYSATDAQYVGTALYDMALTD